MRAWIPLTGTYDPVEDKGQEDDPVRIFVNLGDVSWYAVAFDWEKGRVQIEFEVAPLKEGEESVYPTYGDKVKDLVAKIRDIEAKGDTIYEVHNVKRLKVLKKRLRKERDEP